MTPTDLATGNALLADMQKISAVQTANGTTGAKAVIVVTSSAGVVLTDEASLRATLGDSAYEAICATALASMNTGLASNYSTKSSSLGAL